jgi:hypothetical protein
VNRSLEDARQSIRRGRFREGTVARIPHKTPRDTVLAQDPSSGRDVKHQDGIHLLVSAGLQESREFMPDIRGKGVQEALKILSPYNVMMVKREVDTPGVLEDVVLNQEPAPFTLISQGQVVTYEIRPSGSISLPDSQFEAVVRHSMEFDWYDSNVEVDVINLKGERRTLKAYPPRYDELSKSQRVAGSTIAVPVQYIAEATVVVSVNGDIAASYYIKDGEEPKRREE